jgi:ATP-dependent DNA helicase RecQ
MAIKEILKQYWGFDNFRPLQEEIIQSVLAGKDTLALLPTGGGKSICFQVPAMYLEGICIVISPLIALMKDQVENLNKRGILAMAIFSGMGKREIDIALDNCVYGPVKFLYLSPERLLTDLVKERIKYMKVNLLAVDEAHCVSQWGYDFRPPYLHIADIRKIHPKVPILALTASATDEVRLDIVDKLEFKNHQIFKKSFERENLSYSVLNQENKLQKLVDVCTVVKGSGIVYVKTRRDTVEIAKFLNQHQISSQYYHAGLNIEERSQKQNYWINNQIRVMVATNAFGMGIDKPDVRFVVHYEIPESLEAYYQEAGRAGRDEKKAYAVILFQERDRIVFQKRFLQNFPDLAFIKQVYHYLCNYLQIPYEAGHGITYNFDLADFCVKFQIDILSTISAIKFLEYVEYFVLSENALLPSRLQFIVNGEDLYKFQVENAKFDGFVKSVLRLYGGAFDQFIAIKESDVAQKTGLSKSAVWHYLIELDKLEIISYQPQSNLPLLTFLQPRVKTEDVVIDANHFATRKITYQKKMEAMLTFATKNVCRNMQLLTYFNETNAKACGVCDVCLANKRATQKNLQAVMASQVLEALKTEKLPIKDLLQRIKKGTEQDKLDFIRLMLAAGEIKQQDQFYFL